MTIKANSHIMLTMNRLTMNMAWPYHIDNEHNDSQPVDNQPVDNEPVDNQSVDNQHWILLS